MAIGKVQEQCVTGPGVQHRGLIKASGGGASYLGFGSDADGYQTVPQFSGQFQSCDLGDRERSCARQSG